MDRRRRRSSGIAASTCISFAPWCSVCGSLAWGVIRENNSKPCEIPGGVLWRDLDRGLRKSDGPCQERARQHQCHFGRCIGGCTEIHSRPTGQRPEQSGCTQGSYDNKDYAAVVAGAPAVLAEVSGLAGEASAKKDESLRALGNEWRSLAATIPQSVTAVQTRVDALSKSKHVPKDVDLTAAKSGLADATAAWEQAQTQFKSGNASDAVGAAKDAKSKLDSAASALKLTLPQAT